MTEAKQAPALASQSGRMAESEPAPLHPACFTHQEYLEWKELAVRSRCEVSPCSDCDKPYRTKMKSTGRCNESSVRVTFAQIPGHQAKRKQKRAE